MWRYIKPVSFNWVHFYYSTYAALCPPPPALVVVATRVAGNLYRYSSRILTPIHFLENSSFFFFPECGPGRDPQCRAPSQCARQNMGHGAVGNKLFCDGVLDQIPIPMHLGHRPS